MPHKIGSYIKSISTEHTGGNTYVDFIELKDGAIITITDEYVVVYANIDAYKADLENDEDSALCAAHLVCR